METVRRVLLLGEGNFSYALARAKLQPFEFTATSFDSIADLTAKYPESL
jgi:hypothetical protein